MAIKKSELYSSLWASCDELRGGMDASQYKDYVLFMLFIKYISDKYADTDDFAPPVTIPAGASFKDMVKLKGKSDIGDKINTQIIQPLIDNNSRLARSDFPDFNDPNKLGEGKAMVDRLTNLVSIFQKPELDFSKNRADHDDILGDAYEYLMRHFASESGKSKGQFYTPSEVSRIIAKVIGISPQNAVASTTAYDPTCGSGSLLLKVAAEAGKYITLEGQEKDVTTAGLARMNMILHDFPTANILNGNTLASPKFKDSEDLRTYDFVVANPPFSDKTWSTGLTPATDPYQRFEWGEPPAKQGDYAYLLHIIRSMKSAGKAACILPHGVLFRGNAEAAIRKRLVRSGYLKGIIGLPANLFYGTGIPACILVLDKENAPGRKGVFMIDASRGFIKDGNKNRLREQDIHKIVNTFNKQTNTPRYARMVPFDEISDAKNDYNLNLPRYIDSTSPEDIQDIDGHLRGGIPDFDLNALDAYWQVIPGVRQELFESAGRPGYFRLKSPIATVKSAILSHTEFTAFKTTVTKIFHQWRTINTPALKGFNKEGHPKALIETIAEDLLTNFRNAPLLDAYDIYQPLMDYWAEAMQDDCYLIAADGWVAKTHRVMEEVKSGKKKGEMKDKGWVCDLIPKPYIVARYFAKEQAELDALQNESDAVSAGLTELAEEHGGEEGALKDVSIKGDAQEAYTQALVAVWNEEDKTASRAYSALMDQAEEHAAQIRVLIDHHFISVLKNNKGKLTLKAVKDRLATTGDPKESAVLSSYLEADKEQKAATKKASELLAKVKKQYQKRLVADPLPENFVDLHATVRYLSLLDEQSALKSKVKEADAALDKLAYDKYPKLSVDEIKTLVVDDKWLATLAMAVQGELDRVSQTLTTRIRQLAERYDTPLPKLVGEVADLSARVDEHLMRMGAVWK
ncbi:type I restriction-modification system subunit M [Desulfobacter sp.]|uniref:type I restriction-modification system subunit M n=1 Tax=Desulfobacter sp. TaxID=2294 RepID=UPI000E843372|nr:type I restriction-modification system subunit M [Desulfobacter sp.]HBT88341.1 type I restriction-modification system subunit M [Desulfobacter sp.]